MRTKKETIKGGYFFSYRLFAKSKEHKKKDIFWHRFSYAELTDYAVGIFL